MGIGWRFGWWSVMGIRRSPENSSPVAAFPIPCSIMFLSRFLSCWILVVGVEGGEAAAGGVVDPGG
jgi:hypothetical protein